MTAASMIAAALGGRKNGAGWRARCPAHEDDDPSLDITEKNGLTLFICRAGCSQDAVLDALRACGIWENGRSNGHDAPPDVHSELGRPDHRYEYTDRDGATLGWVYRWDAKPGRKKQIRPVWHLDSRWQWAHPPAPKPLFGLTELVAFPDRPVLLVEGEKAVIGARDHVDSHVVMTWLGGTGAVQQADLSPLKGRRPMARCRRSRSEGDAGHR